MTSKGTIARLNLRAGTGLSAAFGLALTFLTCRRAAMDPETTRGLRTSSRFRASVPMRGWKIAIYYDQMGKARPPIAVGEVLKECRALVLTQRRGKSNI